MKKLIFTNIIITTFLLVLISTVLIMSFTNKTQLVFNDLNLTYEKLESLKPDSVNYLQVMDEYNDKLEPISKIPSRQKTVNIAYNSNGYYRWTMGSSKAVI